MIDFNNTRITNLIFHRASLDEDNSLINNKEYYFDEVEIDNEEESEGNEDENTLKNIFLKPFTRSAETFQFTHEIDLELNPLYKLSKEVFEEEDFIDKSKDIYQHLTTVSKHPNIKDGDLFIVKYDKIAMGDNYYQGLGIYKIENKESFVETVSTNDNKQIDLEFKKGIGTKRLDKACLILFTEEPYTILIIDNANIDTEYWKHDFINVAYKKDEVNSTSQFMSLTKSYITEQFPNEYEANKTDQIDLLNRSVDYFKSNDNFDKKEFEEEVFQDENLIESFRDFDTTYQQNSEIEISDNFEISNQAVKKQARIFKKILKLDKNFHIYIHGDKELIEQGVEGDGRKFYKIYYQDEN